MCFQIFTSVRRSSRRFLAFHDVLNQNICSVRFHGMACALLWPTCFCGRRLITPASQIRSVFHCVHTHPSRMRGKINKMHRRSYRICALKRVNYHHRFRVHKLGLLLSIPVKTAHTPLAQSAGGGGHPTKIPIESTDISTWLRRTVAFAPCHLRFVTHCSY